MSQSLHRPAAPGGRTREGQGPGRRVKALGRGKKDGGTPEVPLPVLALKTFCHLPSFHPRKKGVCVSQCVHDHPELRTS